MMRILSLLVGPPVIVSLCYWLTWGQRDEHRAAAEPPAAANPQTANPAETGQPEQTLALACREKAARLRNRLSGDCRLIIRPPFILAGDRSEEKLDRYHRMLVQPIAEALSTSYFDREPDEPITILIFSGEKPFQEHAGRLDGRRVWQEYGYYQRADRRIVMNAATGNGTLAHELTHALAQFDFPDIPEWFDEGLATVHEECDFSEDRLRLNGLSNWRLHILQEAIRSRRLESLQSLMTKPSIEHGQTALDYAHTRYFCLYLQKRRLLSPYYRKFRRAVEGDPTGVETLKKLLQRDSLERVQADFRKWAISLDSSNAVRTNR